MYKNAEPLPKEIQDVLFVDKQNGLRQVSNWMHSTDVLLFLHSTNWKKETLLEKTFLESFVEKKKKKIRRTLIMDI